MKGGERQRKVVKGSAATAGRQRTKGRGNNAIGTVETQRKAEKEHKLLHSPMSTSSPNMASEKTRRVFNTNASQEIEEDHGMAQRVGGSRVGLTEHEADAVDCDCDSAVSKRTAENTRIQHREARSRRQRLDTLLHAHFLSSVWSRHTTGSASRKCPPSCSPAQR